MIRKGNSKNYRNKAYHTFMYMIVFFLFFLFIRADKAAERKQRNYKRIGSISPDGETDCETVILEKGQRYKDVLPKGVTLHCSEALEMELKI